MAFTALLLNRELRVTTENNQFRARIGTFAVKQAFERALLSASKGGGPPGAFQKLIPILQEGQLAEEITIADLEGRIVASTSGFLIDSRIPKEEAVRAQRAQEMYSPQSWFYAEVDTQDVTLYTPITLEDIPQYIAILRYSLGNMGLAIGQIRKLCAGVAVGVIIVIVPLCLLLIRAILKPIQILNVATKEITAGNLDLKVQVSTGDELGELAQTFNEMTSALARMKQRAENTNPLTKLPGNNVIHEVIEKKLQANVRFVAIYADLDNFKAFNDKYGIGAGDQVIQLTATILREATRHGSPTDFIGHEGGDDFVILTIPEKAEPVTSYLCAEFDNRIREAYPPEDRKRGSIISQDREGNVKQFPLMTISLAGVSNVYRKISSYAEVTNIWAELKQKTKALSKNTGRSCFYLDQRSSKETRAQVT
jgi:diguanylate cyclase (GGDEF)-like protein